MNPVLLAMRDVVVEHRRAAFPGRPALHVRALDGVSLELCRGEVLAVVGRSGAGKSTLARAALALEPLRAGTVAWSTQPDAPPVDVDRLGAGDLRRARRRFGVVFQDPRQSLDPRWSARRTLTEALRAGGASTSRAALGDLVASVGLAPAILDRRPHEMSGGEAQRVCIARALCTSPEALVLDEPVSALDASVQAGVLDLLDGLRRERGLAFLLVAHDPDLVAWMADRVLVLEHGRVRAGDV